MAFENVFDSSLVDYSKDNEYQDNKHYNDNIVDIVANRIKSGENIPHTFCFDNFKIYSQKQNYCFPFPDINFVLYDNTAKICYATEIIEYTDNVYEWFIDEIGIDKVDLNIVGSVDWLGMIIVKIPALNNRNFIFFIFDAKSDDDIESLIKVSNLADYNHYVKDDDTINFIEFYIKKKFNVLNLGSRRFDLVTMKLWESREHYAIDLD